MSSRLSWPKTQLRPLKVITEGAEIKLALGGIYADPLFVAAQTLELNVAVDFGEDGVIPADAYIEAGVDFGAALANEYVARDHKLSSILFDPATF